MNALTRIRVCSIHLQFKYNFQDTFNPICNSGEDNETSCLYLLHCSLYINERVALRNVIQGIDNSVLELGSHIVEILLYRRKSLDLLINTNVLNAGIEFLLETRRFEKRLF